MPDQVRIAKLLVSFRCQVKIREGQVEVTAWTTMELRWWWRTCAGEV